MYTFIGMDEAGLGPNLGPLLISATSWKLPEDPRKFCLWSALESVLTSTPEKNDERLHVADSKEVYTPSKGLRSLEKSVLAFLSLTGHEADRFHSLWKSLTCELYPQENLPPWFHENDLELPLMNSPEDIMESAGRLRECLDRNEIQLSAIQSDLVIAERFNQLLTELGNKGAALSTLSLSMLRKLWDTNSATFVVADKHGGRNRYDEYLSGILEDEMIFRIQESKEKSIYRINSSEIRFQMKAESHLPVALASMVSKYLRELSMDLFNSYWKQFEPDLKPTKGYPQDARRFRKDIQEIQKNQGIADNILWRAK